QLRMEAYDGAKIGSGPPKLERGLATEAETNGCDPVRIHPRLRTQDIQPGIAARAQVLPIFRQLCREGLGGLDTINRMTKEIGNECDIAYGGEDVGALPGMTSDPPAPVKDQHARRILRGW